MNCFKVTAVFCVLVYLVVAEETVTTASSETTTAATSVPNRETEHRRQHGIRRQIFQAVQKYENTFFKLAPNVYDQMMTAVKVCDTQLKMDTDSVKTCVTRRMNRQHHKKKQDKNKASARSQRQVEAPSSPSNGTTGIPVIRDEEVTETPVATDPSVTEQIKSWRNVVRYERTIIRCFVDDLRKSEFKDKSWKEWRDVRDQKVAEFMTRKEECMQKQLFRN